MFAMTEFSSAVRTRRADMGLTQTALAGLSGLSRATINQLENGTLQDLSLTRVARLLGVLGLSVHVTAPRAKSQRPLTPQRSALDLAAATASVSYRTTISEEQLREVFRSKVAPDELRPHLSTLLDEAPMSLLASAVEELHAALGVERTQIWKQMRDLARQFKTSRPLWL